MDIELTSLHVSIPTTQKEYVQKAAAISGCSTPSEYIRRLIAADQQVKAQQALEHMLLEGIQSGKGVKMTEKDWDEIRNEVLVRINRRKAKR